MPIKGGNLLLPVKADIRKKIKKEAGDWVNVVLYRDQSSLEIPEELLICLQDEPAAYANFMAYKEGHQKIFEAISVLFQKLRPRCSLNAAMLTNGAFL